MLVGRVLQSTKQGANNKTVDTDGRRGHGEDSDDGEVKGAGVALLRRQPRRHC